MQRPKNLKRFRSRPYRSKRLQEYYARMSKDNEHVLVDDNVKDMLLSQGYQVEESPRSIYSVDKLFEALSHYAPGTQPEPAACPELDAGISLAYSAFARHAGQQVLQPLPLTPETIVKITSNPAGSPGVTNYGCTKAESMTRALERGVQTLKGVKYFEPCLAFKRTQFNGKTRLVWGYPYSMTAIEGLIAYPLIQHFKRGTTPMAFAMTSGHLGTKLRVSSYRKEWAYSLDMSQYDATLSRKLIHISFDILRTWFDLQQVEPTTGVSYLQIMEMIESYFINTPIVMPDGRIYHGKDHGVPSGSYFTQIIDSIANVIICGTISAKFHLNVDKRDIYVLGDDLLFWTNRHMSLDKIATYANQALGVKMHGSEKSSISHYDETIHYLGRDWDNGLPTLDQKEVIKRMVYPETFRRYSKDPVEKERQVRMLILAYAATYRSAWRIAYDLLDGSDSHIHNGCSNLDVNTYCHDHRDYSVDPDHLSGLQRYLMKYVWSQSSGDIPITALQYWL